MYPPVQLLHANNISFLKILKREREVQTNWKKEEKKKERGNLWKVKIWIGIKQKNLRDKGEEIKLDLGKEPYKSRPMYEPLTFFFCRYIKSLNKNVLLSGNLLSCTCFSIFWHESTAPTSPGLDSVI
jgi:hypothetical protein